MVTRYIDETRLNQTGNTFGEKQVRQTEDNEQESSQQRTSSPGKDTEETNIKIKMNQQETQTQTKVQTTEETNKKKQHNTLLGRLRKKGSPISGGIQPRQEDKGKRNECDTDQKRTQEKERETAVK